MVHGTTSHPFPYLRGYCFIAAAGGIVAHPPVPPCFSWGDCCAPPKPSMPRRRKAFSLGGRISSCHPNTPNLKGEILCIWKTCRNPSQGYHCRKVKGVGGSLSALRLSFPKPQGCKGVSKARLYKVGTSTLFPRPGFVGRVLAVLQAPPLLWSSQYFSRRIGFTGSSTHRATLRYTLRV